MGMLRYDMLCYVLRHVLIANFEYCAITVTALVVIHVIVIYGPAG